MKAGGRVRLTTTRGLASGGASGGGDPVRKNETQPGKGHRADHRVAIDGQGDVHGPVASTFGELAGPVERVDDPHPAGGVVDGFGTGRLLGADPVVRELASKRVHDQPVRPGIALGPDRLARFRRLATQIQETTTGLLGQCCRELDPRRPTCPPLLHGGRRHPLGYAARCRDPTTRHDGRPAPAISCRTPFPGRRYPMWSSTSPTPGVRVRLPVGIEQSRPGGTVSGLRSWPWPTALRGWPSWPRSDRWLFR